MNLMDYLYIKSYQFLFEPIIIDMLLINYLKIILLFPGIYLRGGDPVFGVLKIYHMVSWMLSVSHNTFYI